MSCSIQLDEVSGGGTVVFNSGSTQSTDVGGVERDITGTVWRFTSYGFDRRQCRDCRATPAGSGPRHDFIYVTRKVSQIGARDRVSGNQAIHGNAGAIQFGGSDGVVVNFRGGDRATGNQRIRIGTGQITAS